MLTLSYKTPLELWQFDVTGQLNGGGELYDQSSYPAYFQLQAQVTREFHRFSLYVGYFIGAFYLIIVIFKIVARVVRGI